MQKATLQNIRFSQSHLTHVNLSITVRSNSSSPKWKRTNIEDYTCDWSFPIRTLVGKGRRNDVIKELRSNQQATRPLIVTDKSVYKLPITQVFIS